MSEANVVSPAAGQALVRLARRELELHFGLDPAEPAMEVAIDGPVGGVFVTLRLDGELRGCIGYVLSHRHAATLTKRAVVGAATGDPRFEALSAADVPRVTVSVSVLAEPVPLEATAVNEIVLGRDGVIVERETARGLLLPQVAVERGWDRERFVAETCHKAGLPSDSWRRPGTIVWRFAASEFDEYSVNNGPTT